MGIINKLKSILLEIIILCLFGLNTYIVWFLIKKYEIPDPEMKIVYGALFFIIECLIVFVLINKFYSKPIKDIVLNIKKANLNKGKLIFKKTINPNLTYINKFFAQFLEGFKGIKTDFLRGKVIKGEVELAKEIQERFLNKKIVAPPSLEIEGRSKPLGEIGGDSYDIIKKDDNHYIYIGDATGHGVGAGFIMVMVNALIESFINSYISGADILTLTNKTLKPRIKANLLMSALLLRWNEKEKRLFMTGAGHEYLFIYKHKLGKCFKIKSGGLALGMMKDISKVTKEREIDFEENDIAVLYSDGVTDAINSGDNSIIKERFGETRIIKAIENSGNAPGKYYKTAKSVFANITLELSKFMGYKPSQTDDVTLVVIHYKGNDYEIADIKNDPLEDKSLITEWNW